MLERTARDLLPRTGADACVLSRVVGDVLIVVAQATREEHCLSFGQGFLVSDFPATAAVLRAGDACALVDADADADPAETALLRELGFASLLMLPFDFGGERFGLCELYRREPSRFGPTAVDTARELLRFG